MRRVSASLTVVMLAASGHPVTPTTLRSWVYRGHITRGQGGYDLQEILKYIQTREASAMSTPLTRNRLDAAAAYLEQVAARLRAEPCGPLLAREFEVDSDIDLDHNRPLRSTDEPVRETVTIKIEWRA